MLNQIADVMRVRPACIAAIKVRISARLGWLHSN